MVRRALIAAVLAAVDVVSRAAPVIAADRWIEVNASEGSTTRLGWQLEQVRSALAALWPWAKLDLNQPLVVFASRDESSMKALAPAYWQRKGGVRPASVGVGGVDQNHVNVDVAVKREGFTIRPIAAPEAAARQALFHTAMHRPGEARAAIDAARKGGESQQSAVAEALLLDAEDKDEGAKAAFARAVEQQTTNAHAYYRLAALSWHDDRDRDTPLRIEKLLTDAIALNTRFARAYSLLAQTRSMLGTGDQMPLALRAITLDPSEPALSPLGRERTVARAQVR